MAAQGSKAKFLRDLLDRAIELRVPNMSPSEFERLFGLKLTEQEIAELTFGEAIVRQLVMKAAAGNDRSIGDVMDRLLGKAVQATESTSKSYSYHDFLIECRAADAAEAKDPRMVVEVGARRAPKAIAPPEPQAQEPYDPVADLL